MQLNSGVLDILNSYPLSAQYLDIKKKQNEMLSFWTRPTIGWSLTCEEGNRKEKVLWVAKETLDATDINEIGLF